MVVLPNRAFNLDMFFPTDIILDTRILGRIYENTSATYKFYWFISILDTLVREKRRKMSFWEIIVGMVVEAWYPIHYFRLSFGRWDMLYQRVIELQKVLDIPISTSKNKIKEIILHQEDNSKAKKILSVFGKHVPYRFLSPWIQYHSDIQVIEASNLFQNNCLYSIQNDFIEINSAWANYLSENYTVLRDYTFWGLTNFIQKRNPNTPNIPTKLQQTEQRASLVRQRHFWDVVIDTSESWLCIYSNTQLGKGKYDLDHFVPWSFVTHNLMWNLVPSERCANISKGNSLPSLEMFLYDFAKQHQHAVKTIYYITPNNKLLEDYLMLHDSVSELSYLTEEEFLSIFRKTFTPMVQIAENMGFKYWDR